MEKKVEIFEEILATSKMGGFVDWSNQNINYVNSDNPSWTWQEIKRNPWMAMAVYEDLEDKDARVGSCLETRKNAVLSKAWRIMPASDSRRDKKIAAFVEETLRDHFTCDSGESDYSGFDAFLFEALDAISKGVSIGEIIFGSGRDRVFIENIKFKPQQLFAFGDTSFAPYSTASLIYPQTGSLKLRQGVLMDGMIAGGELPESKFFVFSYRPRYGNRWGQALLKYVFWASWMKRASVRQWLKYQEKGTGAVIAKYPGGASLAEQSIALDAATAVIEENAVAVPERFVLEFHEMIRNLGSSHKELVDDFCNVEITLRLLGQSLTSRGSDGGGSRALGEVHNKVRGEYTETDCRQVAIPINKRLVKPLVIWNFGPNEKLPTFRLDYEPEEDLDTKAVRFGKIRKEIGIELSKTQVRDELQLDAPLDEEDTLGEMPAPAVPNENPLDDDVITEFAEKKKIVPASGRRSNSKRERFARLRPSMIRFSNE